jgi:hypothetical protein
LASWRSSSAPFAWSEADFAAAAVASALASAALSAAPWTTDAALKNVPSSFRPADSSVASFDPGTLTPAAATSKPPSAIIPSPSVRPPARISSAF